MYGYIRNCYEDYDKILIKLISIFQMYITLREQYVLGNSNPEFLKLVNETTAKCLVSNKRTVLAGRLLICKGDIHVWRIQFTKSEPLSASVLAAINFNWYHGME